MAATRSVTTPSRTPPKRALSVRIVAGVFSFLWTALVVLTPLLGVWVASSLAAYRNGPVWAVCLAGFALFPLLPVAWELRVAWRRRARGDQRPRALTLRDRVVLRTLAINLLFLGLLLGLAPKAAFTALAARGDWMLDGHDDTRSQRARRWIFRTAGYLEWLYRAANKNPYRAYADGAAPETPQAASRDPRAWPLAPALHPLIATIPASVETSPEAVARYLAERESDPLLRVKALHDYVADRVAYDVASYRARRFPPQDAATVFRTRLSVCAGYAALFDAMARSVGVTSAVVVGDARGHAGEPPESHAWNAVKVNGRWLLLDATWDAGTTDATAFHKQYRTDYLFAPPEVFGVEHFPDDARWQLRERPLGRGEFLRQPWLEPGFFVAGMSVIDPDRAQIDIDDEALVRVRNPNGWNVSATYSPLAGGERKRCEVDGDRVTTARCAIEREGQYVVTLYAAPGDARSFPSVATFQVNRRP